MTGRVEACEVGPLGRDDDARDAYRAALALDPSSLERRFVLRRLDQLEG